MSPPRIRKRLESSHRSALTRDSDGTGNFPAPHNAGHAADSTDAGETPELPSAGYGLVEAAKPPLEGRAHRRRPGRVPDRSRGCRRISSPNADQFDQLPHQASWVPISHRHAGANTRSNDESVAATGSESQGGAET